MHSPAVNHTASVSWLLAFNMPPKISEVSANISPPDMRTGPKGAPRLSSAARMMESPMGWMDV